MEVIESEDLSPGGRAEIQRFCEEAYGESLAHLFEAYDADFHVLARLNTKLVSHAMVVTRWLQPGTAPLLRAAYVEMVATAPDFRGRGAARAVMEALAERVETAEYEVAALCPADTRMYEYLGWEYWQGPLFVRQGGRTAGDVGTLISTPEERVMVFRLSKTPLLDLAWPLSVEWRPGGELW